MVIIQIGPHTFHLHEIYGLSSASTQPIAPAVNPTTHTYPPAASAPAEDEPSSECLVCLSSPREVVLLPCRHLVACKECAINMVEFGAGGAIMHTEESTTIPEPQPNETAETPAIDDSGPPALAARPAEEDSPSPVAVRENEGNAESSANEPSQVAAQPVREEDLVASSASAPPSGPATLVPPNLVEPSTAPAPQNPRRKRRAKGWSCPVCRQREYPRISHLVLLTTCFDHSDSPYSLHISAADHHHSTSDGWRQRSKALLDVDGRPPVDSHRPCGTRHCYRADKSHPRPRVDAGGAGGSRACALTFIAASVPPCTLASPCRPCVTCLIHDSQPSRTSFPPAALLADSLSSHPRPPIQGSFTLHLDIGMQRAHRMIVL
jgi:hypothetical protein